MVVRVSSLRGLSPDLHKAIREAEAKEKKASRKQGKRRERVMNPDGLTDLERAFVDQLERDGLPMPDRLGRNKLHPIPGRRFEVDLAWTQLGIVVELHGGVRAGLPSHTSRLHVERDHEKAALCTAQGLTFLAFTDAMVADGRALEIMHRILARRAA